MRKFGLLLLCGALSACASRPPAPAPRPAPPPVERPAAAPALSPAAYAARIASIEQFVARACALGLERIGDPAIRARLTALAADHRGLSAQLRMAGQRLNLLPSPALGEREQRWWAMLEASQPFEIGLQRRLLQAHQEAIAIHQAFAERGDSPTLRQFARHALGVERAHSAELVQQRFLAR